MAVSCRDLSASIEFYERLGIEATFGKNDPDGVPILQQMRLQDSFVKLLRVDDICCPGDGHIGLIVDDAD